MRILVAHNSYQRWGGEDAVVDSEIALLRGHGHDVEVYRRHNDELQHIPAAKAAVATIWSQRSTKDIGRVCAQFRPDLIHVHNTFPLISPSLYWATARLRIPVVQTLHNFRILCPQGMFFRDGRICEDCVGKIPWRAVARKCYRTSAAQSSVLVSMLMAHRTLATYRDKVTFYIALNAFCRDKFIEGGLPKNQFRIKPNFVESSAAPSFVDRRGGLFVGRLCAEKGFDTLVGALKIPGSGADAVEVIGGGPFEPMAKAAFGSRYLGFLPLPEILQRMGRALYLVMPSIGQESLPRTAVEAYSCGLPLIASRLGPLVEIVHDGVTGLLFNPGDPADLAAKIAWAEAHPEDMLRMGRAARAEYEAKYTPQRNYQILTDIYEEALAYPKRRVA